MLSWWSLTTQTINRKKCENFDLFNLMAHSKIEYKSVRHYSRFIWEVMIIQKEREGEKRFRAYIWTASPLFTLLNFQEEDNCHSLWLTRVPNAPPIDWGVKASKWFRERCFLSAKYLTTIRTTKQKKDSMILVCKRTILTEQLPLDGEV
jgi:hypothetical protein